MEVPICLFEMQAMARKLYHRRGLKCRMVRNYRQNKERFGPTKGVPGKRVAPLPARVPP